MKHALLKTTLIGMSLMMGVGTAFADSQSTASVTFNFTMPANVDSQMIQYNNPTDPQLAQGVPDIGCSETSSPTTKTAQCTYSVPTPSSSASDNEASSINYGFDVSDMDGNPIVKCPSTAFISGSTVTYNVTETTDPGDGNLDASCQLAGVSMLPVTPSSPA